MKGAPEKIISICNTRSIPKNFNEILKLHSKKGYRVLACATKPLKEETLIKDLKNYTLYKQKQNNKDNDNSLNYNFSNKKTIDNNIFELRNIFEKDLNFLGFIIISNELKTDSKTVIKQLKEGGCKIVMTTGENPLTSISVAKNCDIITIDKICLIDLKENELY